MCSKQKQDKTPEVHLNEMKISDLPDRVQINGHKDINKVRRTIWEQHENFIKER